MLSFTDHLHTKAPGGWNPPDVMGILQATARALLTNPLGIYPLTVTATNGGVEKEDALRKIGFTQEEVPHVIM